MSDQTESKFVPDAFWQEILDSGEGGGGGIVSNVKIETGFKIYVGGLTNEQTWFPAPGGKKNPAHIAALNTARIASKKNGISKSPSWAVSIICPLKQSFSKGKPATWKGDRFFVVDTFTSAAQEVVVPSLQENGIHTPWSGWARISFREDPFGTKEKGQDGEERTKLIAYVAEVYPDEAAAMAAVRMQAGEETDEGAVEPESAIPSGYTATTWNKVVPMLQSELAKGKAPAAVAAEYGMDVKFVIPLIAA